MLQRWRPWLAVAPADGGRLLTAAAVLGAVGLALRWLPLATVQVLLGRFVAGGPPRPEIDTRARQLVRAVEVASRRVPGADTCLVRALAAQVLLARAGYPTELHIGAIRGPTGALAAHAWLESRGQVVIGDDANLPAYTRLTGLAERPRRGGPARTQSRALRAKRPHQMGNSRDVRAAVRAYDDDTGRGPLGPP